ncbi:MAG: hypothetical protein ACE5IR_16170 [bacterium]
MATRLNDLFFKVVVDGKEAKVSLSQVSGAIKKAESQAKSSFQKIGDFGRNAFFVFEGFRRLAAPLKELVEFSNQQEQAEKKLAAALKATNNLTQENIKTLKQFAAERQKVTTFGDEATIEIMAQLHAMGLNIEQTKEASKQAQNLAALMGTDLASAARVMADVFNGSTGMISRYIKGLDQAAIKSGDLNTIMAELNSKIGGQAEALAQTGAGELQQFTNLWGDFKEVLGDVIKIAIVPLIRIGKQVLGWFIDMSPAAQRMGLAIGIATTAIWFLRGAIQALLPALGPVGWVITGLTVAGSLFGIFSSEAKAATSSMAGFRSEVRGFNVDQLKAQIAALNLELRKLASGEGLEGPGGRFAKASSIRREQIKKEIEELERQIALIKAVDEKPKTTTTRRERTLATFEIEGRFPDTIPGAEFTVLQEAQLSESILEIKRREHAERKQLEEDLWTDFLARNQLGIATLEAGYDAFFGTILDKEKSAKEKREAIWESMKAAFLGTVADMLKAWIFGEIKKTVTTQTETGKRLAISLAAMAKEAAATLVSIGKTIGSIAAKLFAWFASKGPVGIALGLGAVPALIATVKAVISGLSKLGEGGIGLQPTIAEVFERGPEAIIPLDRRGADFMAQLIPKLQISGGGPGASQADFEALGERIAAAVENVRIEIRSELDAIKFFRKEFPKFQRTEARRTF